MLSTISFTSIQHYCFFDIYIKKTNYEKNYSINRIRPKKGN